MRSRLLAPAALTALALIAGSLSSEPAFGDWLVTRDGQAMETRGGWDVRDRLVVFETENGTLASMRLDDVDLEASRALTERAEREKAEKRSQPPAEEPAKLKARFVLTDADVLPAIEAAPSGPAPPAADDAEARPEPSDESPLRVVSWESVLDPGADGVVIRGVARNPSEDFASGISIRVTLRNVEGVEIEPTRKATGIAALAPGEQGTFEASFPGVFTVGGASFDVASFDAVVSD